MPAYLPLIFTAILTTQVVDPLPGGNSYVARIGEKIVIHEYSSWVDRSGKPGPFSVSETVPAWVSIETRTEYAQEMAAVVRAYQVPENAKTTGAVGRALGEMSYGIEQGQKRLIDQFVKAGKIVRVPDMTPGVVVALATFFPNLDRAADTEDMPEIWTESTFVRITEGPHSGKILIFSTPNVRDPGKGRSFDDMLKANNEMVEKQFPDVPSTGAFPPEAKPEPPPKPWIRLLGTNWEATGLGLTRVTIRVHNSTAITLRNVTVSIPVFDRRGGVLTSGHAIIGTMEPGDTKTVTSLVTESPANARYDLEFEASVGAGETVSLRYRR